MDVPSVATVTRSVGTVPNVAYSGTTMDGPPRDPSPSTPSRAPVEGRRRLATGLAVGGEILITLGVVMALLVVWELWWTDLGGARHQREAVDGLTWTVPAAVVPLPATSVDTAPIYRVIPAAFQERTKSPPAEPVFPTATTFATLYVPRWGSDYVRPISEGVGLRTVLDPLGIGHYPGTAEPGGWGNFAIAGHRTTYGKPFADIDTLQVGDVVAVRTADNWYVYRVTETHIVRPNFGAAVAPVPGDDSAEPNGRYITMTSCHPKFSASHRYVVYGVLDYWAPAWAGYPSEVVPPGARTVDGGYATVEGTVR